MTRRTLASEQCFIEHTAHSPLLSRLNSFITPHGSSRSHLSSFSPSTSCSISSSSLFLMTDVLLELDNVSWPRTLVGWTISFSGSSRIHPSSRWSSFTSKRMDSRHHENWACIRSHDQFSIRQTWDWNSNWDREPRQFSFLGQNFSMEQSNMWSILLKTTQKFLQIYKKSNFHKQAQVWLQPGQRQKQNHTTESTRWDDSNHTNTWKKTNWHGTIRTKSCLVRSLEESHQSSSTQSDVTTRRRWSTWTLQDKISSSKSLFTNTALVCWSMESLFGCRRRIHTKISILLWSFENNYIPPCSSRTFWKQSHWFYATGQCVDWN